jgi:CRISPR-associated Csx2 family protein
MAKIEKHILITGLGIKPTITKYSLNGKVAEAEQSTIALLQLLPAADIPDEIIVLCTEKVKKEHFPKIKALIENGEVAGKLVPKSIRVSPLDIPDGKTEDEIWVILKSILNSIPRNCSLTLDLTHGFRSYPFLFFTAAIYLKALHNVNVRSVFYGMVEVKTDYKPIIDLSLILDMIEWFYATRTFRETGQARAIIDLLSPFADKPEGVEGTEARQYGIIKNLINVFLKASSAYEQALPVEFGIYANQLDSCLIEVLPSQLTKRMPLPEELFSQVSSFISPYKLSYSKDKERINLDDTELQRQAKLIDTYFDQGYINNATALMREWIVNSVLYHKAIKEGKKELVGKEWLTYNKERKPIEKLLGLLEMLQRKEPLPDGQKWLAGKWKIVSDKRNALSHSGFRNENALLSKEKIMEVKQVWEDLKKSIGQLDKWNVNIRTGNGTLLINSLGNSKGSLYSALTLVKPDSLFVIASKTTKDNIKEIIEKAGWLGVNVEYIMEDPFAGFTEGEAIVNTAKDFIDKSKKVVVNLTGGTTVMQYLMQLLSDYARKTSKDVEVIAVVDRRTVSEQQENPYVVGELITMESVNKK